MSQRQIRKAEVLRFFLFAGQTNHEADSENTSWSTLDGQGKAAHGFSAPSARLKRAARVAAMTKRMNAAAGSST